MQIFLNIVRSCVKSKMKEKDLRAFLQYVVKLSLFFHISVFQ